MVWKTEEKGLDVNIASYLLVDGFKDDYEVAVVISGDSDLTTPIALARCPRAPGWSSQPKWSSEQGIGPRCFVLQTNPYGSTMGQPVSPGPL